MGQVDRFFHHFQGDGWVEWADFREVLGMFSMDEAIGSWKQLQFDDTGLPVAASSQPHKILPADNVGQHTNAKTKEWLAERSTERPAEQPAEQQVQPTWGDLVMKTEPKMDGATANVTDTGHNITDNALRSSRSVTFSWGNLMQHGIADTERRFALSV